MELPSFYKIFFAFEPLSIKVWRKGTCLFLLLGVLLTLSNFSLAQSYPLTTLKADIAKFLTNEYSGRGEVKVSVGNIDRRLRLHNCTQELVMLTRDSSGNGGNISVQVQCKSMPGWTVNLPAQVAIFREIPVASHDLARGDQITDSDITWETTNISDLRQAYLTDNQAIIGQEVKRNIGQGLPFLTSSLDAPTLIKRGDLVDLQSLAGTIRVSTSGTAMTDGRLGQKIRIKNNQSDRIVTGTVVASGKVSTL